jgi:hypothetical protein
VEVVKLTGDRLAIDRMPTVDAHGLTRGGEIIVDQLALVMRAHREVTHWLIAVGLPSQADAHRLADAVKARLVSRGVPAERVEILAAGGSAKVGGLVRQRSAPDAASACPAAAAPPRPKR